MNKNRRIKNKKWSSLLFFVFGLLMVHAQNSVKIDSLEKILKNATKDTNTVITLNQLARQLKSGNPKRAEVYANQALQLSQTLRFKTGIANSYNTLGVINDDMGNNDEAITFFKKSLTIHTEINNKKGIAICHNNIGLIYLNQGKYEDAHQQLLTALKIREEISDKKGVAGSYNNIGRLFDEQGNYKQALIFYLKSLAIKEELGDQQGMANSHINIGLCYGHDGDLKKELDYYLKGLELQKKLGDKKGMSMIYNNIGENYSVQKNYAQAIEYFQKAIILRKELSDQLGLAQTYNNMGKLFSNQKQYKHAGEFLEKGLELALNSGSIKEVASAHDGLSNLYAQSGNFNKAYQEHKLFSQYKDSLLNEKNTKQITDIQTKYETDKKEQQNILLAKDNNLKTAELQKQQMQKYILVVSLGLMAIMLYLFYNNTRLKNSLRESQTRERIQKERERISRDLHDNVGAQLSYIISGVESEADKSKESKQRLENISHAARNTMNNLRETIWALNGDAICFDDFTDKLKKYVSTRMEFCTKPELEIKIDELDISFSHSEALNLYRITQEAINNAVKYSNAGTMTVKINSIENHKIQITIQDNGKGFDINAIHKNTDSYGLKNMKFRAAEIQADLNIFSEPGKGTTISIAV